MSEPSITFKLWTDSKTPMLTIAYEEPEKLFVGNGHSYLQMRKMLSDYFKRHDVKTEVKENVYIALEYISKAHMANSRPSPTEIKKQVVDDMNRLYNTKLKVEDFDQPNTHKGE